MNYKLAHHVPVNQFATEDDFRRIFDEHIDGLYRLAFMLTTDSGKAEQCFVAGLEGAVRSSRVFRDWAHSWAKRTVINNAIRMMNPRLVPGRAEAQLPPSDTAPFPDREVALERVLELAPFERFVFVMNVLERYSEHDCALLLNCAIRDVRGARLRAITQIASPNVANEIRSSLDLPGAAVC